MRRHVLASTTAVVLALSGTAAFQAVTTTASTASSGSHSTNDPVYLNTRYSPEERAADLVSRMTLAEKASQMNSSRAAAIPRLGVAAYGWWNEAAHGVAREQTTDNSNPPVLTNTTSYPVSLSLGSTWNPELMYDEASLIGDEARDVVQGNQRDLDFWSPTVNLGRDPRWGRNDETYSEDPYLTTAIASKFVDGMEGKDENGKLLRSSKGYLKTITTLKHFAANNSEFNRRNGSSDMDDRTLREYYTAQFRGIVKQSQPGSIMSSYNSINGTPAAADVYLIDQLARKTFGFKGYFTSDCDAIYEIQAGHKWQPPGYSRPVNQVERHAFANSAGEDLDCNQGYHDQFNYGNTVPTAVQQGITTQTGLYTENDVDVSVMRLFTARMRLGEFDDESTVPWVRQARQRLAPGTWTNSDANGAVTQTPERLAMARKAADESLVLLKNDAVKAPGQGRKASTLLPLQVPRKGSYKVAVVGPYANPDSMYLGGYSSNQGAAGKANQVNGFQGISKAVKAIDPQATVDYLPGLSADHKTVIAEDVAKVKGYDAVVVYAGTDNKTADEDTDRTSLALPGAQAQLIEQVAAANPRTVAYLETMGQVDVESFKSAVPAILWSSYNGQRKGEGLADVLLGRHNPSGHLPFTWYRSVDQLPAIGDYTIRPTATTNGRTYQYFNGPVSYPFGHGLGYSSFRYSKVRADRSSVDANGRVTVTAKATNTGQATGTDVVQLYAATPDSKPALERPIKRLAGFERVTLKPGRSTTVRIKVKIADLAFYDEGRSRYVVDQGRYDLQLASSAKDVLGHATTRVRGSLETVPSVVTTNAHTAQDAARDIPQRVLFAKGDVIDPQVSVTLNDDRIFGYVAKGKNADLPAGMTVTYRSNRPKVVDVSRRGIVKATGSGVATVTAKVRYHGKTASSTFVVHVG